MAKKTLIWQVTMLALLLLISCQNTVLNEFRTAYEEATKELATAQNNADCDRIHDKLLEKLYNITKAHPDWKETVVKGKQYDEVTKAYAAWGEALKKATTDGYWMFMTFCTPDAAIEHFEGNQHEE